MRLVRFGVQAFNRVRVVLFSVHSCTSCEGGQSRVDACTLYSWSGLGYSHVRGVMMIRFRVHACS